MKRRRNKRNTATYGHQVARRLYPVLGPCEGCGGKAVERHHRDGNTSNNAPENIAFVCRRCHVRMDRSKPPRPCAQCGRVVKVIRKGCCARCYVAPIRPCVECGREFSPLRRGRCGPCADRAYKAQKAS